mmetsp:Transcript_38745/g.93814  ORF Transcript_38745/g.93814 Transcript_38745/m.93814 type:complete len:333 (-) Transcript_38745:153-1151(-)
MKITPRFRAPTPSSSSSKAKPTTASVTTFIIILVTLTNLLSSPTVVQSIRFLTATSLNTSRRSFLLSGATAATVSSSNLTFFSSKSSSSSASESTTTVSSKMVDTTSSSSSSSKDGDRRAAKIWDKYAESYSKSAIGDEEAYQKKLEVTQTYMNKSMKKIIEIGCGTGGTALKHSPFVGSYVATDVSPKMIDIANQRKQESDVRTKDNVEYRVESIDTLHSKLEPESQDMVLGLSILHLLPNRLEEMKKISSWIKPGGYFVSSTICAADMGWMTKTLFKSVLPVATYFGFVPTVCAVSRDQLKQDYMSCGFDIVHEWQPKKDAAVFIIGQKK